MDIHIGCSGYNYREWKGMFYPVGLSQSKWLEYYALHYNTVEINATFYRFPTEKSLKNWYDKTPAHFRFSIKANNQITHYKKFNDAQSLIDEFYKIVSTGLREKLDCVLFQFPPGVKYTQETLECIVKQLDLSFKNVLEFRNASWWNEDVYKILREHNITFCVSSYPGLPDDFVKTTDVAYVRLHGKTELYKSNYSDAELHHLQDEINRAHVKETFIYFDNTWGGNAIANAVTMEKLTTLNRKSV